MRIGAFMGGMTEVMCTPIKEAIEKRNGRVVTNSPVTELLIEDNTIAGVKVKNRIFHSEKVILAVTLKHAQQLLRPKVKNHPWFNDMMKLRTMPAITIQFELKRRSMKMDRTTFGPGTCWASFAEQNHTTFRHVPGRLSVILTPPEKFFPLEDSDIRRIVLADGIKLGIAIADDITDFRVTRLQDDFYSLSPGSQKLRPEQKTPIFGLYLAGDFTLQPYLATMEGAVASGQLAADALLAEFH